MGKACSICASDTLRDVNDALIKDAVSIRDCASQFGLAHATVGRHRHDCLKLGKQAQKVIKPKSPKGQRLDEATGRAEESRPVESLDIESEIMTTLQDVRAALADARASGNTNNFFKALKELRPLLDLYSKLEERGRHKDDEARAKMYKCFAAMPDWVIAKLAEGDEAVIKGLLGLSGHDVNVGRKVTHLTGNSPV